MNVVADSRAITAVSHGQAGVFSKADLQVLLAERHPSAFGQRIRNLIANSILQRFCRGWYVTPNYDLATLSQRLAPRSYISFATVLARKGIVGTRPKGHIVAVKLGRPRRYVNLGVEIEHVSISEQLFFGFAADDGIQYADAEKAVVDSLYYHLRGRSYPFDIYSDLATYKLDSKRLKTYLQLYKNQKFRIFARDVLEAYDN